MRNGANPRSQYPHLALVLIAIFRKDFPFKLFQEAFFGKNLLDTISKKKGRRNDGDTPSTPSEDGEKPTQVPFGDEATQLGVVVTEESFPQHEHAPFSQSSGQAPYPAPSATHNQESQRQYPGDNSVPGAEKQFSTRPHQSSSGQHHTNIGLDNHERFVLRAVSFQFS